jgi:uroporphyrin-III C-methyltransferase/precorrin-2 dehydrogenase/sirohydrochlorin ferrochelatase
MSQLLPLFLDLEGRRVLLVGGGLVAASKLTQLTAAGADVRVVSPEVCQEIERAGVTIERRGFESVDLDDVWLVVAAATPEVNRAVAAAAAPRRLFVNAVDDPANASAYLSGVVRRDGLTLAISTSGAAPSLTALLRQALDAVLPHDLASWTDHAREQRVIWRREGVPMDERRPLLLAALNRLYDHDVSSGTPSTRPDVTSRFPRIAGDPLKEPVKEALKVDVVAESGGGPHDETKGHVSLVGAGPGDPGLLTRRAVARLRAADLVLYDALIDRRVLRLARHAQKFFVGKRASRQAMSQPAIHALMIRAARRGKRVVRLKGGDPFVFGRGGEEVLALRAAGISVDVTPGVTSATAAPALAGIPVTHRGVSSAFLVVGGHDEATFDAALDSVGPSSVTLIILMGMAGRVAIADRLIARGWRPDTPAALIVDASAPTQSVWRGTLEDLSSGQVDMDQGGPGTIVVGHVVEVADHLQWPDHQTADGQRSHRREANYSVTKLPDHQARFPHVHR